MFGRGRNVYVVQPYACAADDLELFPGLDDGLGRFCLTADDEGVVVRDDGDEFLGRKLCLDVDFKVALPFYGLNPLLRKGIAY